jgi:hypothetical protein
MNLLRLELELSMKRLLLSVVLVVFPLAGLVAGPNTVPLWENHGTVMYTNQPQIDAVAFANYGTFLVASPLPYDFMNTRYYTNRGSMIGYAGFRFDYTDDLGIRRPAANFVNENARLLGSDAYFINSGYSNLFSPSYLLINATNVVNRGYLGIVNAGTMRIQGQNVDLSRGGLEVLPLLSGMMANVYWDINGDGIIEQFSPDNAIWDYWWGAGIQDPPIRGPINTANILRFTGGGVYASSPPHQVWVDDNPNNWFYGRVQAFSSDLYPTTFANTGVVGVATVTLTNIDGSLTNYLIPTNIYRQAVIVGIDDTNLVVRTKFYPSFGFQPFAVVSVGIESLTTNIVSDTRETTGLYWVDYLGAETNLAIWNNHDVWYPAMKARPAAYEVWRTQPYSFMLGANGNSELFRTIVYGLSMSNVLATNYYAGYYCLTDYLESRPPVVPGATPTNLPGRIEIVGDTVDLSKTRLLGMGSIAVNAKHLKGSAGARVDVQYLAYDLASTNGLLTVQSLTKEQVVRVNGNLSAWSGLWTNQYAVVLTNWGYDANSNWVAVATNVGVDVGIHCLILNGHMLQRTQQVIVHSLNLRSTNLVQFNDPAVVGGYLVIDAPCFTLNGKLVLTNALMDWTYTNAPNLRYFTNNGILSVQHVAFYGSDYPGGRHWSNFVNRGTLQAVGHRITSDLYQNSGLIVTENDLLVVAEAVKLEDGRENALGDIRFYANDLKLRRHTTAANRTLFLSVTNSLTDGGSDAMNQITVNDGFRLLCKPRSGDLLGTRIETRAPQWASIAHTWAAADRGATAAGFQDNAAIGTLALRLYPGSELRFGPETGVNGLYVDYLDLDGPMRMELAAGNLESVLTIEPGLTVYFAYANVPVESLDGKCEGRLRWVREFAGPNSGVDVALRSGEVVRANIGLVDSITIDSDGDGLANGYDEYPFDGVTLTEVKVVGQSPFTALISWQAAPNGVYRIECATNLAAPSWQTVAVITNDSSLSRVLSFTNQVLATNVVNQTNVVVTDMVPPGGKERYYRVRYDL